MRQLAFLCSALLLLAGGGSRVLADAQNPTYIQSEYGIGYRFVSKN